MTARNDCLTNVASQVNAGGSGRIVYETVQRYTQNAAQLAISPFVLIHEGREAYADRATLGKVERRLSVVLEAWEDSDPVAENRSTTAADLLDDMEKGVTSDRTLGGNATDVRLVGNELFLADEQSPRVGAFLEIEIFYTTTTS